MGHQAGRDFFLAKRAWSKRKDRLLELYIPSYLEKVSHAIGKPIVLIDGFAGRGKFLDGSDGSPLILYKLMRRMSNKKVGAKLVLIEQDVQLHEHLQSLFQNMPSVNIINSSFMEQIPLIVNIAKANTVFLYIDPFAVREYQLTQLKHVFELVKDNNSIEVLINLNILAFVRLIRRWTMSIDGPEKNKDELLITGCAGGDWWKTRCADMDPKSMGGAVREGFSRVLRGYFAEVCMHDIRATSRHAFPKYTMVYASRSEKGLELMNDAMATVAREFVHEEILTEAPLFAGIQADRSAEMCSQILQSAVRRMSRRQLRCSVIRSAIGQYKTNELNAAISKLIGDSKLVSSTGKSRINDQVDVWQN